MSKSAVFGASVHVCVTHASRLRRQYVFIQLCAVLDPMVAA